MVPAAIPIPGYNQQVGQYPQFATPVGHSPQNPYSPQPPPPTSPPQSPNMPGTNGSNSSYPMMFDMSPLGTPVGSPTGSPSYTTEQPANPIAPVNTGAPAGSFTPAPVYGVSVPPPSYSPHANTNEQLPPYPGHIPGQGVVYQQGGTVPQIPGTNTLPSYTPNPGQYGSSKYGGSGSYY
jgi:hypothetical protein